MISRYLLTSIFLVIVILGLLNLLAASSYERDPDSPRIAQISQVAQSAHERAAQLSAQSSESEFGDHLLQLQGSVGRIDGIASATDDLADAQLLALRSDVGSTKSFLDTAIDQERADRESRGRELRELASQIQDIRANLERLRSSGSSERTGSWLASFITMAAGLVGLVVTLRRSPHEIRKVELETQKLEIEVRRMLEKDDANRDTG